MKKVSLFALALSTTVATWASAQAPVAVAAPGAVPVANPCPCPKAFQGFHLGGNVGYGIGFAKTSLAIAGDEPVNFQNRLGVDGFDGGLNVGYTHRFGNFGLGLEGVFNWTSTKGRYRDVANAFQDTLRLQNSIQARANLSYVICNLVAPKIILGWDNSQWTRSLQTYPGNVRIDQQKKRFNSFLWGAGVDFLLAKHVIAGLEYTGTVTSSQKFADAATGVSWTTKPQYNKVALTIKFIY